MVKGVYYFLPNIFIVSEEIRAVSKLYQASLNTIYGEGKICFPFLGHTELLKYKEINTNI